MPWLTLALAGWSPNELTWTAEPNLLVISGEKAEPKGTQYLYRGIPSVAFEQRFSLADHVQVRDARMTDGLLVIDLVRELPEALRPRRIEIANSNEPQALEQRKAASARKLLKPRLNGAGASALRSDRVRRH